jgi:hypothetical protein
LKPAHLRVDVDLSTSSWKQDLERGAREARILATNLAVALFNCEESKLKDLAAVIRQTQSPISTWLLFPASRGVIHALRRTFPRVKIAAGTNADFYFLNQPPRDRELADFTTFAIHPQTHATDNRSLVETLAIQAETVANARRVTGGLPVVVSPVTLKARFNPDATAPDPPLPPGELPSQVDPRQMSLFGAAWTVVSLKYLAEAGASSVTFYETTGWRGVMELAGGSALPHKFRSVPGGVFPIYHVLADIAEFKGGKVLPLRSNAPLAVDGIALRKDGRTRVILANFTGVALCVALPNGIVIAGVRTLDETSSFSAMKYPVRFLRTMGRAVDPGCLTLSRYSVARIDLKER